MNVLAARFGRSCLRLATDGSLVRLLGGRFFEACCAALLATEMVLLLAGVIARYIVNRPLIWTEELASSLFLWLTIIGSALALARGTHLRLTSIVGALPPRWRRAADLGGAAVSAFFFALLLMPAFEHYEDGWYVLTPAMGLPGAVRAGAIVFGCALMLAISLARLAEMRPTLREILVTLLVVAGVGAALFAAQPMLKAMGNYNLIVFFAGVGGICLLAGIPIAFGFGLATLSYLSLVTPLPLSVVASRIDEGIGQMILLSIPLFIFLGLLVDACGMARALVAFLAALVGHVRAGLSYVLIGAMYLVSGISGAKAADIAAIAPVLFPEMRRRGEEPGEMVSLVAASAVMAETIPPSLVLIAWGSVTGVSIAALFTGGLIPALVLAIALAILAYFRARVSAERVARAAAPVVLKTLVHALPTLALLLVIRAAVFEGIATATEVSVIGVAYCLTVGWLYYRELDWRALYPLLVETAVISGAIMLIIGAASAMAWALTQSGFSRDLVAVMSTLPGGAPTFMALSIMMFVVFGSVLEGIPAIVLLGPLMTPIATFLGINEIHYAMVAILSMGLGLYMPPFGLGYYTACAIAKTAPEEAMGRIWPYMGALAIGIVVVAAVPWLSTCFL